MIAERISAKRHSLILHAEVIFLFYDARSREPTIIRRSSVNAPPPTHEKTPRKGVRALVEVVGVEPTSYSAAKKLSTYLVYLLFLKL